MNLPSVGVSMGTYTKSTKLCATPVKVILVLLLCTAFLSAELPNAKAIGTTTISGHITSGLDASAANIITINCSTGGTFSVLDSTGVVTSQNNCAGNATFPSYTWILKHKRESLKILGIGIAIRSQTTDAIFNLLY